jgi:hypothetical protein
MSNGQPNPPDYPPQGGGSYPPGPGAYGAPVPEKKSAMPWIIGGCGCALLLALLIAGTIAVLYFVGKNAREREQGGDSRGGGTAPSGMMTFVSTPDNIPAGLRENFVPFQFQYPAKFQVVTSPQNFVKVEESDRSGSTTLENFAVGYITMPTPDADNNQYYPQLLAQLSKQFSGNFANYREIAQAPETVGGFRGRALTFQAAIGSTPVFGKTIVVRETGNRRGVALIMLATSADPEVKSVADVGVKGDLAGILASFKFLRQ